MKIAIGRLKATCGSTTAQYESRRPMELKNWNSGSRATNTGIVRPSRKYQRIIRAPGKPDLLGRIGDRGSQNDRDRDGQECDERAVGDVAQQGRRLERARVVPKVNPRRERVRPDDSSAGVLTDWRMIHAIGKSWKTRKNATAATATSLPIEIGRRRTVDATGRPEEWGRTAGDPLRGPLEREPVTVASEIRSCRRHSPSGAPSGWLRRSGGSRRS